MGKETFGRARGFLLHDVTFAEMVYIQAALTYMYYMAYMAYTNQLSL